MAKKIKRSILLISSIIYIILAVWNMIIGSKYTEYLGWGALILVLIFSYTLTESNKR